MNASEKGLKFENEIALLLDSHPIVYEREKRISGYGGRWRVDFFLPKFGAIIECKSSQDNGIMGLVSFMDIQRALPNFDLILVVGTHPRRRLINFCLKYGFKVVMPSTLINALNQDCDSATQKYLKLKVKEKVKLYIQKAGSEGITKKEIANKLGCKSFNVRERHKWLLKNGLVASKLCPKRFFSKESYPKSREAKLIVDILSKDRIYSTPRLAQMHGFSIGQIGYLREKMGKKAPWGCYVNGINRVVRTQVDITKQALILAFS